MRRLVLAFSCVLAVLAGAPAAQEDLSKDVNLSAIADVLELKAFLQPHKAAGTADKEPGTWYSFAAINLGTRPATRVLQAGQLPSSGLGFIPRPQRPMILQVVSTDPGVLVQSSNAYGRKGFLLTLAPSSKATVAVRMAGTDDPPSLLAWTGDALAAHNRKIAIFVAAVAGLIAAAAVIAGGVGVLTHHWAPRWAALSLTAMLLTRLASLGVFDGSIVTSIGGPYGLTALFGGLALAGGLRFVDLIEPLREVWPTGGRWLNRAVIGLLVVSGLAYIGLPVATFATDVALFAVPPLIFAYLLLRQRHGSHTSRILQPAAGLFALVSITTAFAALGGFGSAALVPDLAGGFAAAGAIMLVLAVTAGEGISVLPWRHHAYMPQSPPPQPAPPRPAPPVPVAAKEPEIPHAALEAIGASRQGVFELDLVNNFALLSAEAAALLGRGEGRLSHYRWMEIIHADDRAVYEQAIGEFRKQSGLAFRIEFRVLATDGRYLWLELRATMKGPDGEPAERCVGLLADVTTRKEAEAEMMDRSLRDPLTGLGNRVSLIEELENLGAQLREVVFAVLDVDRFKAIHASLGDAGGDDVLLKIADRLNQRYASTGQIFRVGGDGFAVLLVNPGEKPDEIGAGLVKLCSSAHGFEGRNVFAPVSVGVALGREARNSIDLMKNAELALARAKREGGDCARLFTRDMEAPADPVVLDADLRRALERGEIEVFYQPIVRLADRSVAGFEALLRWRHPEKGLIEPADFIAHSEETGVIIGLGRMALDRAAADLAAWQRHFPLAEPLFVSVNLSRRQLRDPGLIQHLAGLLAGVAPGSFKLEITESTIAADAEVRTLLADIRKLGAGVSIDDFGTGMSSLSQLADLPFDTVKIDKSFLTGTPAQSNGVVLASIVSLAHELKRAVIVEGVETETDAARMALLGCEYAQGYLYAQALAPRDALTFIAKSFKPA